MGLNLLFLAKRKTRSITKSQSAHEIFFKVQAVQTQCGHSQGWVPQGSASAVSVWTGSPGCGLLQDTSRSAGQGRAWNSAFQVLGRIMVLAPAYCAEAGSLAPASFPGHPGVLGSAPCLVSPWQIPSRMPNCSLIQERGMWEARDTQQVGLWGVEGA